LGKSRRRFPPDASKTDNFKVKEPKGTLIINKVLAGNDQQRLILYLLSLSGKQLKPSLQEKIRLVWLQEHMP
jgi:hypothetical protein